MNTPKSDSHVRARASRTAMLSLSFALVLIANGCGGGGASHSLDEEKAREALKTTLDSWKKGESIAGLSSSSPPITAQDFDWMNGAALVSYEIDGQGTPQDANLKVPVKLSLKTKAGREVKKSVNYLVTTSPEITVFRDFK